MSTSAPKKGKKGGPKAMSKSFRNVKISKSYLLKIIPYGMILRSLAILFLPVGRKKNHTFSTYHFLSYYDLGSMILTSHFIF